MNKHIVICGYPKGGLYLLNLMLNNSVENFTTFAGEEQAIEKINASGHIITYRPLDVFDAEFIESVLPSNRQLHYVVIIRDPRKLLTFKHEKVPNDYFFDLASGYSLGAEEGPAKINPGLFHFNKAITALQKRFKKRVTVFRLEDILNNPAEIQAEWSKLFGFKYKQDFRQFLDSEVAQKEAAKIGEDSESQKQPPLWQATEHKQHIATVFAKCPQLFDALIESNYETNKDWFKNFQPLVNDVEPEPIPVVVSKLRKQHRLAQITDAKLKKKFFSEKFIVSSFYTKDTSYEEEMKTVLMPSIEKFSLEEDIKGIDSKGSWQLNIYEKAWFLLQALENNPGKNIIWLDADAKIEQYPKLFDKLDADFAAHFRFGKKLASNTMFLRNNDRMKDLMREWIDQIKAHPDLHSTSEQDILLDMIVEKSADELTVAHLPLEYSMIWDGEVVGDPVIVQHQASRRLKF